MWFVCALCSLTAYYLALNLLLLAGNLERARRSGLPYVVSPVERLNFLWIILHKPLSPILRLLPFGLGNFVSYNALGWWFDGKYTTTKMHEKHGKVFLNVTPGMSELHVADPDVAQQIFRRKWDFDRNAKQMSHAKFYGESLVSVTGQEWARHRRIAAAPFNERMNRIVWDEASRQTRQMSDHWDSFGEKGFSSTLEDINTVTLNVFAKASLGRSWDYCNAYDCARRAEIEGDFDESSHRKLKWTYRDSLFFVTHNIVTYAMIPEWILCAPAWSLPPPLKRFVSAWNDLGDYFQLALRTTKQQLASGEAEQHSSVISYLVTKSAEVRREDLKEKSNRDQGLSDTDIYGTLFALNQTGHDTSKSVLGSTLYLLAAYPEVQQWLRSEIVSVDSAMVTVGGTSGGRIYENTFHQLRRFLAVMNETLRLYPPIPMVYRSSVGSGGQDLAIAGRVVHVPPNTLVIPNIMAVNTLAEYWGDDRLAWRPSRWIDPETNELRDPPKGKDTFFPFAGGPRGCPGRKFAQVEYVAILSELMRYFEVQVVPLPGESLKNGRKRCADVVQGSVMNLTVQMRDPRSVTLKLVRL